MKLSERKYVETFCAPASRQPFSSNIYSCKKSSCLWAVASVLTLICFSFRSKRTSSPPSLPWLSSLTTATQKLALYVSHRHSLCLLTCPFVASASALSSKVRMESRAIELSVQGHTVRCSHSMLFSRWLWHPFLSGRCWQRQLVEPVASIRDTSTLPHGHGCLHCKMILYLQHDGRKRIH